MENHSLSPFVPLSLAFLDLRRLAGVEVSFKDCLDSRAVMRGRAFMLRARQLKFGSPFPPSPIAVKID